MSQYVDAVYVEQEFELYKNNPFIEALPPIQNRSEIYRSIRVGPPYDENQRNLDDTVRIHNAEVMLQSLVYPLAKYEDIATNICSSVRYGYTYRNPFSKENIRKMQIINKLVRDKQDVDLWPKLIASSNSEQQSGKGFSVIGNSGLGKSTAVRRILATYPQVILHKEYKGMPFIHTQLVWLKLECSANCTIKSLCLEFFTEVDKVLFTNYREKFGKNGYSAEKMRVHMVHIASIHSLGVLFIDEIQHLTESKYGSERVLDFLVTLQNTIGVPIVYIGTPDAYDVFGKSLTQSKRAEGMGGLVKCINLQRDKEWEGFLKIMWKYQWTKNKCELTEEINDALYDASFGIPNRLINLYSLTQRFAISSNLEIINAKLINLVAKNDMELTGKILEGMKEELVIELLQNKKVGSHDNHSKVMKQVLSKNIEYHNVLKELVGSQIKEYLNENLTLIPKVVDDVIDTVIASYGFEKVPDMDVLKKKALELAKIGNETSKSSIKKNKNKMLEEGDLRNMAQENQGGKIDIPEILADRNIIRNTNLTI
jgi:ABC-type oligopeptide transport system ATPase subunit